MTLDDGGTVEFPERWIAMIDAVRAWCASDAICEGIFRLRYGRSKSKGEILREMMIRESSYKYSLKQIRVFSVTCAAQAQVVKVF